MIGSEREARLELQSGGEISGARAGDEDGFVTGGLSAHELDGGTAHSKNFGEEFDEGGIGRGIDWRSGDADFQLRSVETLNLVAGGARLKLQGKVDAIGCFAEAGRAHFR